MQQIILERSTYAVDTSRIHFIRGNVTGTSRVRGTYVARTKYGSDRNTAQTLAYQNSHRYASDTPLIREYVTELLHLDACHGWSCTCFSVIKVIIDIYALRR